MSRPTNFNPSAKEKSEALGSIFRQQAQIQDFKSKAQQNGGIALHRLVEIAHQDTGQSYVVRKFLLGCYDGQRFPFNLTDFRSLDLSIFQDCQAVLAMDWSPAKEVHSYVEDGSRVFEAWAK